MKPKDTQQNQKQYMGLETQSLVFNENGILLVNAGYADIFVISADKNQMPINKPTPIGRIKPGQILFGLQQKPKDAVFFIRLSTDAEITIYSDYDTGQAHITEETISHWLKLIDIHPSIHSACKAFHRKPNRLSLLNHETIQTIHEITKCVFSYGIDEEKQHKKKKKFQLKRLITTNNNTKQSIFTHFMKTTDSRYKHIQSASEYDKHDLYPSIKILCDYIGTPISNVSTEQQSFDSIESELKAITSLTELRVRKIKLKGKWFDMTTRPYLAFFGETKMPCVLLPSNQKYMKIIIPGLGTTKDLTPEMAAQVDPIAFSFYPTFSEQVISLRMIFKLAVRHKTGTMYRAIITVILIALLGLLPPIITGKIVAESIPDAQLALIFQLTIILVASAISIMLFHIIKGILIVRYTSLAVLQVKSAVLDRLMKVPMRFFGRFSHGDLTNRLLQVSSLVSGLAHIMIHLALGSIYIIISFLLMLYYEWDLSIAALIITIITTVIYVIITLAQRFYAQQTAEYFGSTYGIVTQILIGINKLKLSFKENIALTKWAALYAKSRYYDYISFLLDVFKGAVLSIGLLTPYVLFYIIINWVNHGKVNLAYFIAFTTAFAQFSSGVSQVCSSISGLIPVRVSKLRVLPILETLPESSVDQNVHIEVKGNIVIDSLSFSYGPTLPLTLDKLSLNLNAGDSIAITGPSGCGKSTLIKLLIGFERPKSGHILYDEVDLNLMHLHYFREQIGVVLQNNHVFTGSILQNIIGAHDLSEEDAWHAAEKADIADEIKAMPMGMHTMISDTSSTISGGQKQRILIARALVKKPKILIFDEATSALDNRTQQRVTQSIEALKITKILIAHRLSTIIHCDRVIYMENGKVIEQGTFEELNQPGSKFHVFAKHQML